MANINQPNVKIQVLISEQTAFGRFNDALYFSLNDFNALSDNDLSAAMKARVNSWVENVKNPPKPAVQTIDDVLAQADDLQQNLQDLQDKLNSNDFADAPELDNLRAQTDTISTILSADNAISNE